MSFENLNVEWADVRKITPGAVEHETARNFIANLRLDGVEATQDVYICSDARMFGLRQILSSLGNTNIIATAGNGIEHHPGNPAIVIAHGDSEYTSGCGAVDYVGGLKDGEEAALKGLAGNLVPGLKENGLAQLEKIPEESRAGVFYFDQTSGTIYHLTKDTKLAKGYVAEKLFASMAAALEGRYTQAELDFMAGGQDPEIIVVNNYNSQATPHNLFRVDLPGNELTDVVSDSLAYSMSHALNGEGSFKSTKSSIFAFDKSNMPNGLDEFVSQSEFMKDYIGKGGNIYLVGLGALPEQKEIYQISIKK